MVTEESSELVDESAPLAPGINLRDSDPEASDPVDPWDYEPPKVSYDPIYEDDTKILPTGEHQKVKKVVGYVVNPKFGLDWPPLKTLQHFAALIEYRTSQKVRVIPQMVDGDLDDDELEYYEVMTNHSTGGPAPYEIVYAWLSGFENGIHELLWSSSNKKQI